MMMSYRMILGAACAAGMVSLAADQTWNGNAGDGNYTNALNWSGSAVPVNGEKGTFGAQTQVTLYATNVPMYETSRTWVYGSSSSASPTVFEIDSRGSSWTKGFAAGAGSTEVFKIMNAGGGHLCNIEGVTTSSDYDHLTFSNALFRYVSSATNTLVEFVSGDFNIYDSGRGAKSTQAWILGYNAGSGTNRFVVRKDANIRAASIQLRGNTANYPTELIVEGGQHYLSNALIVKEASGDGCPARMLMTGGTLDVANVYVSHRGHDTTRNYGELILTNDATMTATGYFSMGTAKNADAHVLLAGHAKLISTSVVNANDSGAGSSSRMDVVEDACVEARQLNLSRKNAGAIQTLNLRDRATWLPEAGANSTNGRQYFGYGSFSTGIVTVADHAVMRSAGNVFIGYCSDAYGRVEVSDDGVYAADVSIYIGCEDRSTGYLSIADRATVSADHCVYLGYPAGRETITGATVRVTGGTLNVGRGISMNGINSLFDIDGGTVTCNLIESMKFSIGTEAPLSTGCQLNITNGLLTLSSAGVSVGSATNEGRIRLLQDGCIRAKYVTGNDSASTLHSDGGTLELFDGDVESGHFATAMLGASGLTIRNVSATAHPVFNQVFTDEAGASGTITFEAPIWLKVSTNSAHANTHLATGELTLASGVTQFGRNLTADGGTTLYCDDAAGLTCETLTLGTATDGAAPTTVQLDSSAAKLKVTAANGLRLLGDVVIQFNTAPADGAITVFETSSSLTDADLRKLHVKDASGKYYRFSAKDGTVTLTVSSAPSAANATWTGATDGAWATAANWQGETLPGDWANVTFPAGAATKSVTLAASVALGNLTFAGTDGYRIGGSGVISDLNSVTVESGTHEIAVDINPVAVRESCVEKAGTGTLVLSGDNRHVSATWNVSGGKLTVASANALGDGTTSAGSLLLTDGTFAYTGDGDLSVTRGLQVNHKTANMPAAVNVAAGRTLTLTGSVNVANGIFVKDGAGELILDLAATGSGTHVLDASPGDVVANASTTKPVEQTAEGVFTSSNGLGSVTVVEGTLHLKGAATGVTQIRAGKGLLVGANATNRAETCLVLDHVNFSCTGGGLPLEIGGSTPASSDADASVRVINDAYLSVNTATIGRHYAQDSVVSHPTLAVTNSSFETVWGLRLCESEEWTNIRSTLILNGSRTKFWYNRSTGTSSLYLGPGFTLEVSDDAFADFRRVAGSNAGTEFFGPDAANGSSWGTVKLLRGGTLLAHGIMLRNTKTKAGIAFQMDGGRIELVKTMTSYGAVSGTNVIMLLSGGGTICVTNDVTHTLGIPYAGEGTLVKTGAGTLALTNALNWKSDTVATVTDLPVGGCAKTRVAEGVLALAPGSVATTMAIEVVTNAVVDLTGATVSTGAFSGGGTIRNGTLATCGIAWKAGSSAEDLPLFTNVALGAVRVDFGIASGSAETIPFGTPIAVARLGSGTTYDLSRMRARNAGTHVGASFTVQDGILYATARRTGITIILR